jgi:hypothetical protein
MLFSNPQTKWKMETFVAKTWPITLKIQQIGKRNNLPKFLQNTKTPYILLTREIERWSPQRNQRKQECGSGH